MRLIRKSVILFITLVALCCQFVFAEGSVKLKNEYIELTVGNDEFDTGRFSIYTTGGDPSRTGDESQPLIYGGGATPWTSFTTIRIDGTDYVYGGKTKRRAGKSGTFGTQVKAPTRASDGAIISEYLYGDVAVVQRLSFVESTSTGLMDSVLISYSLRNTGNADHTVGVRLVLDTMLGSNDGAPFRVGEQARSSSSMYSGSDIPEFWQAFDSLRDPRVTAQGTLRGEGLTPPDRMYFIEWGTPADDLWNFRYEAGSPFLRKGEGEPDSATVLFWDAKTLRPGETKTYTSVYGMGGISITPGSISVGITSPATFQYVPKKANTFSVIAYVDNSGHVKARNIKAVLELPPSLKLSQTGKSRSLAQDLGDMPSGATSQSMWTIEVISKKTEIVEFGVTIQAEGIPDIKVKRTVRLIGPPNLQIVGNFTDDIISVSVTNPGPNRVENVETKLILPKGLKTSGLEVTSKSLGGIAAGESTKVRWQIDGSVSGKGDARVVVTSASTEPVIETIKMVVQSDLIAASAKLSIPRSVVSVGEPLVINIILTGASEFSEVELDIAYDAKYLDVVRYSRGTLLVKDDKLLPWSPPNLSVQGKATGVKAKLTAQKDEGTVVTLHAIALAPGNAKITISRLKLVGPGGKLNNSAPKDVVITIR